MSQASLHSNSNWFCDCYGQFYSGYLTIDKVSKSRISAMNILCPFQVSPSTCPKPELLYHPSLSFDSAFINVFRKCCALRSIHKYLFSIRLIIWLVFMKGEDIFSRTRDFLRQVLMIQLLYVVH